MSDAKIGQKRAFCNKGLVMGILGGITAFLIHGLVDAASIGSKLFLILWFFVGILLATKQFCEKQPLSVTYRP